MKMPIRTSTKTERDRRSAMEFNPSTNWFQFVVLVLALIGLGQVLSGGAAILHRLF